MELGPPGQPPELLTSLTVLHSEETGVRAPQMTTQQGKSPEMTRCLEKGGKSAVWLEANV